MFFFHMAKTHVGSVTLPLRALGFVYRSDQLSFRSHKPRQFPTDTRSDVSFFAN